ncbi:hypothetical protein [Rhizocola hellebori]|uniref:hypothetical protein n=1 Tax=Rhizocola hellebori TaxID=1392758 RepID=UPI001945ABEB|nr:hypothetical protein [Rhizocola hellebori]
MAVTRINRLTDLLAQVLAGFLISVAGVLVMDGFFALLGLGPFGDLNGWLSLIFPIIIFSGQFAAAKGEPGRLPVTIIGTLVGMGLGFIAAGAASRLPPNRLRRRRRPGGHSGLRHHLAPRPGHGRPTPQPPLAINPHIRRPVVVPRRMLPRGTSLRARPPSTAPPPTHTP